MRPRFIGSEIYRGSSYGPAHPLRIPRVSTVIDLSRALGWLPPEEYLTSPYAKPEALTAWHTREYVAALQAAEATGTVSDEVRARHGLGTGSNPIYPEVYSRPATAAGGSIKAGELLREGGIVFNPGGGTHHGMADRANGFCFVNDPVLGILSLRRNGVRRIAYIDIDAHHPDGVTDAFDTDPNTLIVTTHEENRWPYTGPIEERGIGNVWNLPLARGSHDDDMALALDQVILPRVQAFRPDAIMLQCGADAVTEDPLSRLEMSNGAHWAVLRALMPLAPRLLVLGGGGYNPWSVARLWTGVWGLMSGREIPDRLPPEAESILRALTFDHPRLGRMVPDHLYTTLSDTPRRGPLHAELRERVSILSARARLWV